MVVCLQVDMKRKTPRYSIRGVSVLSFAINLLNAYLGGELDVF